MRIGQLVMTRLGVTAMLAAAPAALTAQSQCETRPRVGTAAPARSQTQPLERMVSVPATRTSLRAALGTLAAAARVRLTYSPELLPLERRVCMGFEGVPLAEALGVLLHGTALRAVAAGSDHIVLAPVRAQSLAAREQNPREPVIELQPVIAAASPLREAAGTQAFAVDVLEGRQLAQQSSGSLAQMINGAVPGLWAWPQSSFSPLAQYASSRGASSLGASYPKVYIDGIEAANPVLVSRISPDAIERIEVIRGPQGSALYGADAMGGVTNIVTRHETAGIGESRTRLRSGFGLSASDFVLGSALAQDHSLSLLLGNGARSGGVNLAIGSVGEYMPNAFTRYLGGDGSIRLIGEHTMVTGMVRFVSERTGTARSPMLTNLVSGVPGGPATLDSETPLSVRQYTAGVNTRYQPDHRWTHSIVLGLDGYSLSALPNRVAAILSPGDSALRAAGSSGLRATLRLSTTARFVIADAATAALTVSAEHSRFDQHATAQSGATEVVWPQPNPPSASNETGQYVAAYHTGVPTVETRSNTGFSTQLNGTLLDRLFLNAGVRLERFAGADAIGRVAALPMVGGAWLLGGAGFSAKLRAAYGKSIRWPDLPGSDAGFGVASRAASFHLVPEQQAGTEVGVDLRLARSVRLQVTRFDQLASELVHQVAFTDLSAGNRSRIRYQLQNVGEIANHGWELQGSLRRGRLDLAGTLSLVESQVRSLAAGYTGDLRPGDRPLAVPARMASLNAAWMDAHWSAAIGAYRATDWVNYDRVALARALADSTLPADQLVGAQLRTFWLNYDGFTHLRANAARELRPGLWLSVTGDNLLNYQVGEPDNITVLPGRTLSVSIRAAF